MTVQKSDMAGITTNTIVLIGYCVGNFAEPFVWKRKYQPRLVALDMYLTVSVTECWCIGIMSRGLSSPPAI